MRSHRSWLALSVCLSLLGCSSDEEAAVPPNGTLPTEEALRVAFVGDQGLGPDAVAVLQLIKDRGADFVIHAGDFDYEDDAVAWDGQITSVLGADYPYFADIGNHDVAFWGDYQPLIEARQDRIVGAECLGEDVGVKSTCRYKGLFFILSGVGTFGFYDQPAFLRESLDGDDSIWRVCSWHKNRHDFQSGTKTNEVVLAAYESCAARRALIINGHEHTYSRTLTLSDIGNEAGYGAGGEPDQMEVSPGKSFVTVSGIAGKSLRDYQPELHDDDTWWATLYAGNRHLFNGVETGAYQYTYGALFIDFHIDGDPRKAHGFFENIAGEVVDDFDILAP